MVILFLDIDGVLHPQSDGESVSPERRFCCLPAIIEVLQDFPSVEIVISSMWRYYFELPVLRAIFPPEIERRIIGVTPLYERDEGMYTPALREDEILRWLKDTRRQHEEWIAIDDAGWQFIDHKHRLVECVGHNGFTTVEGARLRELLEAHQ